MAACSIAGCERPSRARGMCHAHYQRTQRGADLSAPVGPRRVSPAPAGAPCRVCGRPSLSMGLCNAHYLQERAYGIEAGQKEAILAKQGGCCAICRSSTPSDVRGWVIDHDHTTGAVRGVLCNRCNVAIGLLGDSAETVGRALDYLRASLNHQRLSQSA